MTPRDFARKLAKPSLDAGQKRELDRDIAGLRLRDQLPKSVGGAGSYFAHVQFTPRMVNAFVGALLDIRESGLSSDDVEASNIRVEKREPIAALLRTYEEFLATNNLFDQSDLFSLASAVAEKRDPIALVAVLGETKLSRRSADFLNAIPARKKVVVSSTDVAPPSCAVARFSSWDIVSVETANEAVDKFAIDAFSPERELEAVLSDVLGRGLNLDQVEIAYTSPRYLPIADSATRLLLSPIGVTNEVDQSEVGGTKTEPVVSDATSTTGATLAEGRPVASSDTGQSLIGYYRWVASGFDAGELGRLAHARQICLPIDESGSRESSPSKLAAFLERRRVGIGRESYFDALDQWRNASERKAAQFNSEPSASELALIEDLRFGLEQLFECAPELPRSTVEEVAKSGVEFLLRFSPRRSQVEADHLRDQLSRIADASKLHFGTGNEGVAVRTADVAVFIADILSRRKVGRTFAKPGHVQIAPLRSAGYSGRKHLYIVGLDERTFPGTSTEDPVLLDEDRALLSADISLRRHSALEKNASFDRIVSMAEGSISLVSSRMNPIFGRELHKSTKFSAYLENFNVPVESAELGRLALPLSDASAVLTQRDCSDYAIYAETHFPWLGNGQKAKRGRRSEVLSEYSGYLGRATPELDIRNPEQILSASALEKLVACPYRYFVERVLGVRTPDKIDRKPGRWLSAPEFGNLLHELFHDFMVDVSGRKEQLDVEQHSSELRALLDDKVERWKELVPSQGEAAFERDFADLVEAAQIFLNAEHARATVPIAFEQSFGEQNDIPQGNHTSRSGSRGTGAGAAIRLASDITLHLRGKIDRVDRSSAGYEIWDYKTGSVGPFVNSDLRNDAIHLQWSLYALAWDDSSGKADDIPVSKSGYFFTSNKGYGQRISAEPPAREQVADRLRPLVEMVAAGAFSHYQVGPSSACSFCDYKQICEPERRAKRDLPDAEFFDNADALLRPVLKNLRTWLSR